MIKKNYTLPYSKLCHFRLFYKSAVPGLKMQTINSIFWILVHMIAIQYVWQYVTSLCQRAACRVKCFLNADTLSPREKFERAKRLIIAATHHHRPQPVL